MSDPTSKRPADNHEELVHADDTIIGRASRGSPAVAAQADFVNIKRSISENHGALLHGFRGLSMAA